MKRTISSSLVVFLCMVMNASAGPRSDSVTVPQPAGGAAARGASRGADTTAVRGAPDSGQSAVAGSAALSEPATMPAFSRCSVLTVPAEALVYIDDSLRGKSPIFIDSLKPGKHGLVLKKKGYFVKKAVINLEAGAGTTVSFDLLKPSRLVVVSEPVGATVHFDGADSCTAPCADEKLKAGTHVVEVTRVGYVAQRDTVTLAAGASDSMRILLKPAKAPQPSETAATKNLTRALISLGVFVVFAVVVLIVESNH